MPPEPTITIEQIRDYLHGQGPLLYPGMLYEPDPSPVLSAGWPHDRGWQQFVDVAVVLGVKILYAEVGSGISRSGKEAPRRTGRLAFLYGQVLHHCVFGAPVEPLPDQPPTSL